MFEQLSVINFSVHAITYLHSPSLTLDIYLVKIGYNTNNNVNFSPKESEMTTSAPFNKGLLVLVSTLISLSLPANAVALVTPTIINAGNMYQISANIIGSGRGGNNSQSSSGNGYQYAPAIYFYQNVGASSVQYQLSTGTNYLLVPYAGTYNISYSIQGWNNNGGSCEWNNLSFTLVATLPSGTSQTLDTYAPSQQGGNSSNCGNSAVAYTWYNTVSASGLPAGTQISLKGGVTGSGTGADNNFGLISGTLGMTLMP
jgi:hypothetical protein